MTEAKPVVESQNTPMNRLRERISKVEVLHHDAFRDVLVMLVAVRAKAAARQECRWDSIASNLKIAIQLVTEAKARSKPKPKPKTRRATLEARYGAVLRKRGGK